MDRESFQERFGLRGSSAALRGVIDRVRRVADTDITVLFQGESGVGKELLAEAVHALSRRRHQDAVVVNCGAIPEGLIESELFGAEKGAYTGAVEKRSGYFEQADGSTIFLDEIGEMPQAAQVRLLRVLETGRFSRVGSAEERETDVRVVAATNKDLAEEVERGRFREDLYYRLSTVLIEVPPLRERADDIVPLFERFLHASSQKHGAHGKRLTDEAAALLRRYRWPGNVRELKNVAEQSVVLVREQEITAEAVGPFLRGVSKGNVTNELMRVEPRPGGAGGPAGGGHASGARNGDGREDRELLYRAILELRMDVRDVKEQLHTLADTIGVAVPRALIESGDFPANEGDYVVMPGRASAQDFSGQEFSGQGASASEASATRDENGAYDFEDVVYEIEEEEERRRSSRGDGRDGSPRQEPAAATGDAPGKEDAEDASGEDAEEALPTLEEAEGHLIRQALRRFEGNRRQTARALGISERTLYRKLKDIDEDL